MPGRKKGRGCHKGIAPGSQGPNPASQKASQSISSVARKGVKETHARPFSMQDIAKNTEQRSWISSQALRNSKINFITPSQNSFLDNDSQGIGASLLASTAQPTIFQSPLEPSHHTRSPEFLMNNEEPASGKKPSVNPAETATKAQSLVAAGSSELSSVQTKSDSEHEVIVFGGRKRHQNFLISGSEAHKQSAPLPVPVEPLVPGLPNMNNDISNRNGHASRPISHSDLSSSNYQAQADSHQQLPWPLLRTEYKDAIADYAGNAGYHGFLSERPIHSQPYQYETMYSEHKIMDAVLRRPVIEPQTLQSDEGKLISSRGLGIRHNVNNTTIISKRVRRVDAQHLVVQEGETVDETHSVSPLQLAIPKACEAIKSHENAKPAKAVNILENTSTPNTSDAKILAMEDIIKDMQELIDREHTLDHAIEDMTDSQIATLLSKQEELGLGSNELIIYNDLDFDSLTTKASTTTRDTRQANTATQRSRLSRTSRVLQGVVQPVSIRDPHDEFDIMDFGRPSLQPRMKGRKGVPTPTSDEELNRAMQNAWSNDRTKKKLRKGAREEARHQGLFGKEDKTHMTSNHREGITVSQLKSDIESFLTSTHQSLSLPPMDKNLRRIVHELANRLSLRSKSLGLGRQRYPQLYKTSFTDPFDGLSVQDIDNILSRGNRRGQRASAVRKNLVASHRGRGSTNAAVYRDGEVVGAEAPELGLENKGHAMLEKMGWSKGTALGALHNKGILQPVSHVVKTTKAGLG